MKLGFSDHMSTVHLAMLGPVSLEVPTSKGRSHRGHTLVPPQRANNQLQHTEQDTATQEG